MVYFLGDWGMGDSDCTSYQHVPDLQAVHINQIQHNHHHHHQHHLQSQSESQSPSQTSQQQQQQQQQELFQQSQQQQQTSTIINVQQQQQQRNNFINSSHNDNGIFVVPQTPPITSSSSSSLFTNASSNNLCDSNGGNINSSTIVTTNLRQLSVSSSNSGSSSSISKNNSNTTKNSDNHHYKQQQQQQHHNSISRSRSSSCTSATIIGVDCKDLIEGGDEVALHPLSNQVGGHTRLLLLNQSTVIKPLNLRELDFYQNIPQDIQKFVPKYKGVMQATTMGGTKLEKRYSPSFRDEHVRKSSASKRKRDDVLRMKVHKNGNAAEVIKSISQIDNSNKQC